MKRTLVTTTALLFALSGAAPVFAAEKDMSHQAAEQTCRSLAAKHHVSKSQLDAYMKSCVEKQTNRSASTTSPSSMR